tara:strand:+ start:155 stop:286 length:132 start_codon:yes stop_codon:yes gene_type:complete
MPPGAPISVFFNKQLNKSGSALLVINWSADDDPALFQQGRLDP